MKAPDYIRIKLFISLSIATLIIVWALTCCFYPAAVIVRSLFDEELHTTGRSSSLSSWLEASAVRHSKWADDYLESDMAESVHHTEVAATEWPMFGSVFFLLAAQQLHEDGLVDATEGVIREAVDKSASIVASPKTATWVRHKWGDDYLEHENVFYRMLLIMGLSSYEHITKNQQYHSLMSEQREAFAEELMAAKLHLLDDYPGECYPNDILWAVAAIQRAAILDQTNHDELAQSLMSAFDGERVSVNGLPAYQMNAKRGFVLQDPRGVGNSGILVFAAELDATIATSWYAAHEKDFWKDNGWLAGFTEMPRGSNVVVMDVDSGPVMFEFGSVASAFGIGAANTVGRLDHSVPLTLEALACSWPTPFGFLVPQLMGYVAVDSRSLGEVALLFSMSRPSSVTEITPYDRNVPGIVWIMLTAYLGVGSLFLLLEVRGIKKAIEKFRSQS